MNQLRIISIRGPKTSIFGMCEENGKTPVGTGHPGGEFDATCRGFREAFTSCLTHQIKRRNGKPRGCSMYQVLRSLARQTQPAIDSTWFNATIGIVDKSYPSYRHHV